MFRTLERDASVGALGGRREKYLTKQGSCSFFFLSNPPSCLTSLRIRMLLVTICTRVLRGYDEGVLACFEPTGSPKWSGHVTVTLTIAKPNTNITGNSLTSVRGLNTCSVCLKVAECSITTTITAGSLNGVGSPLSRSSMQAQEQAP